MPAATQQSLTSRFSTETLLRVSILIFWATMGLQIFAAPGNKMDGWGVSQYLATAGFLGFGLAFWFNTRNIAIQTLGWRSVLLLGFQSLCGFILSTDLMYIVAAEIPLVLPSRAAGLWIVTQTLLLTAWIFWLDSTGEGNLVFLQLPQLPHIAVILLTDLGVFAVHAFAFFLGYLAASEARGRRSAERLNAELRATQALLTESSRLAERAFVARELHDVLGHHLVALKVNLELLRHLVEEEKARGPLENGLSMVKKLLADVREVVSGVRDQPGMDLRGAIETLRAGVKELSIELVFPAELRIDEPSHAHVLFRCVQEAITNTLKHARAKTLWVEFTETADGITLTLRDDGKGAASLTLGNGLSGMRERLEAVGGRLDITHGLGRGLSLIATIPKPDRRQP